MHLLSEKVYARDLMSSGATDFGARGCRARGPTLGAAMAMLTALVLGGCMQTTLNPVSDTNFTALDKQQLTNPPYQQAWIARGAPGRHHPSRDAFATHDFRP